MHFDILSFVGLKCCQECCSCVHLLRHRIPKPGLVAQACIVVSISNSLPADISWLSSMDNANWPLPFSGYVQLPSRDKPSYKESPTSLEQPTKSITPRASLLLLSTENRDISRFTSQSESWMAQNCQNRRKLLAYLCSYLLLTIHECIESWFLCTTPIRHTYSGYSVMHYDCACPSSV